MPDGSRTYDPPATDALSLLSQPALRDEVRAAMEPFGGLGEMIPLPRRKQTPDAVTQVVVHNTAGETVAILGCSAPGKADLVSQGVELAQAALEQLGPDLGEVLLSPLLVSAVGEVTCALFPFCPPLSNHQFGWPIQRRLIRAEVVAWLRRATEATMRDPAPREIDEAFSEPLLALSADSRFSGAVRSASRHSADRIESGAFRPRFVLAHNDLWKGNILLPPVIKTREAVRRHGFIIVDWPSARINGHAMYDLVRVAESLQLGPRRLAVEVHEHCRLLGCDPIDVRSYLLAGLAVLGQNLGYFDPRRYTELGERCCRLLFSVIT